MVITSHYDNHSSNQGSHNLNDFDKIHFKYHGNSDMDRLYPVHYGFDLYDNVITIHSVFQDNHYSSDESYNGEPSSKHDFGKSQWNLEKYQSDEDYSEKLYVWHIVLLILISSIQWRKLNQENKFCRQNLRGISRLYCDEHKSNKPNILKSILIKSKLSTVRDTLPKATGKHNNLKSFENGLYPFCQTQL